MKRIKSKRGMTLAEVLIVIAIIAVLSAVAFIAVNSHQRSLGQLERDGIAKEIFVAAQNHLTVAYGEGYLGLKEPEKGSSDTNPFGTKADDGSYYFVVNGTGDAANATVFDQILPFGSVDETVRGGGSYIIHYQQETGLMLDVFYCTTHGSPEQYNHTLGSDEDEYKIVIKLTGEENKSARRTYEAGGNSILGWYGGTGAAQLPTIKLKAPTIRVKNAEKLYVEVEDNPDNITYSGQYTLKLIITGTDSKAQKAYVLDPGSSNDRVTNNNSSYTVILDDVTSWGMYSGLHFGNIDADTKEKFIPGEDITIQAVVYSTTALANIAYSSKYTTNSLFGSINSGKDTAYIGNIRHLENLDVDISSLDIKIDNSKANIINIAKAEQTDSFSWITFQNEIINIETHQPRGTTQDSNYSQQIFKYNSNTPATTEGHYLPISPDYALTYKGQNHSISDVSVDINGDAGLFGATPYSSTKWEIEDLELIDFNIKGTNSAGALAGKLTNSNCKVINVLARNRTNAATTNVTATATSGAAGGLIGNMSGTVQYSAAAVIVNGTTAGGLIGTASGSVTGCYSGGHTLGGSYQSWIDAPHPDAPHPYDVTGATAGGLIGSSSATINNCYSTCSVSGTSYGAGLLGKATNGSITNCYATGMIDPAGTNNYAFIASGTPTTFSNNYYYMTINEVEVTDDETGKTTIEPMRPYYAEGEHKLSEYFPHTKPLDLNASFYNVFVGDFSAWDSAKVYDASLLKYYSGKYPFRTVLQLPATETKSASTANYFVSRHYGDWPSPEVFFIN